MPDQANAGEHPPRPRLALRIGVTGHRPNKLGADPAAVAAAVHTALGAIKAAVLDVHARAETIGCYRHDSPLLRVVSPLAEGADRIVASEGGKLGFELQVVLPFAQQDYERDFATETSKTEFRELLAKSTATLTLDGNRGIPLERDRAYRDCGLMVLRQCDVLIAIWDGGLGIWGGVAAGAAVGAWRVRRAGVSVVRVSPVSST